MAALKGITWDHPRGYDPMAATAREYARRRPEIQIEWDRRSLQAFADHPIDDLARRYDLIVIDHPHVGFAARAGCLAAFDGVAPKAALDSLAAQSLGVSHRSYEYGGRQWALAIDAAAQVAAYRPDLLSKAPTQWSEVLELARAGKALWPFKPVDAMMSFFTLAANRGTPCAVRADLLLDPRDGKAVLRALRELAAHVPSECRRMNPIQVLERMSVEDSWAYCPLLYGYTNYARSGFRKHLVRFANIPALGNDGPKGSAMGGTGIAVSSKSKHIEAAVDYVLWIASSDCQRGVYVQSGGQPANITAWKDEEANRICHRFFHDTLETLERAWLRPRYDGYLEFQDRGGDWVNRFLVDEIDEQTAFEGLNRVYLDSQKA